VHATENDTDCEHWFQVYADGDVSSDRDPRILRELGIDLPGFDPWHGVGLCLFGVEDAAVERVDVIDLPWPHDGPSDDAGAVGSR
jgi:hypothetical protein